MEFDPILDMRGPVEGVIEDDVGFLRFIVELEPGQQAAVNDGLGFLQDLNLIDFGIEDFFQCLGNDHLGSLFHNVIL